MPPKNTVRFWIVPIGMPAACAVVAAIVTAMILGNNAKQQLDQLSSANGLVAAIVLAVLERTPREGDFRAARAALRAREYKAS